MKEIMSLEQAKLWLRDSLAREQTVSKNNKEKTVEVPFAEYLAKANKERSEQ